MAGLTTWFYQNKRTTQVAAYFNERFLGSPRAAPDGGQQLVNAIRNFAGLQNLHEQKNGERYFLACDDPFKETEDGGLVPLLDSSLGFGLLPGAQAVRDGDTKAYYSDEFAVYRFSGTPACTGKNYAITSHSTFRPQDADKGLTQGIFGV